MNKKISRGLEILLIPLFTALSTCNDNDKYTRSMLIKIDNGHKYVVSVDTNNTVKAIRDGNTKDTPGFYQLIDSLGDGKLNTAIKLIGEGDDGEYRYRVILRGPANSDDQNEYNKLYPGAKLMLYKKD